MHADDLLEHLYTVTAPVKRNGTLAEANTYDAYGRVQPWGYRDFNVNRDGLWRVLMAVALGVAAIATRPATAQECRAEETGKFFASDGREGDNFGHALDLDGDVAIIGAFTNDNGIQNGSAYIFRFDGQQWVEETKLIPSDGRERDSFSTSVAIDGDVAVVGAPQRINEGPGKAYVFRYDGQGWNEEAILTAPDGQPLDYFGWAVAVSAEIVAVGAHRNDNGNGAQAGAAYVFRHKRAQWLLDTKLIGSDGDFNDNFGYSVAAGENLLIIGARGEEIASGAAYVFRYQGELWNEEAKLVASDRERHDWFGWAVSLSRDIVAVSAVTPSPTPSVYVFRHTKQGWAEEAKLQPTEPAGSYGDTISLRDDLLVIGASFDNEQGIEAGAAFLYRHDGLRWKMEHKITASDATPHDYFGSSVRINGRVALIGARGADNEGVSQGALYVMDTSLCVPCTGKESIRQVVCAQSNHSNILRLKLKRGRPDDSFHLLLSTGQTRDGWLNKKGIGRAKVNRLPSGGPELATVTWGCGARLQASYQCP